MQKQFNIFGLSDTCFNGSVCNDTFCVPGYYPLVLLDRPHGRFGGGVASMPRALRQAFLLLSLMFSSVP